MNASNIEIRKAELRDGADICDVHRQSWEGAYEGLIPHVTLANMINRRGPDWWRAAIRRATVLVVEIGGRVVGYATVGRNRAGELRQQGEIYELYVRPEYQGMGLGRKLFREARRLLSEHGLKGLVVWALEDNANALAFYHGAGGRDFAQGFEKFEHRTLKKVAFVWE